MNILDNHLKVHEKALSLRELRMEVIAKNMANADTPNFKARDIDFASVMNEANKEMLDITQNQHISSDMSEGPVELMYRVPLNAAFDGNTVESSIEQANYGKAASDFQASLTFFENRIASIRKALRGE